MLLSQLSAAYEVLVTGKVKVLVHMFAPTFLNMWKKNIPKKIELSTFHPPPHNNPMPHEVSPQILVRGHGRCCPAHPRSPWPRGAARPSHRGHTGLPEAAVCCLESRGPMAKPADRTRQNGRRKNLRWRGGWWWHPTMAFYHGTMAPSHGSLPWRPAMAPYHDTANYDLQALGKVNWWIDFMQFWLQLTEMRFAYFSRDSNLVQLMKWWMKPNSNCWNQPLSHRMNFQRFPPQPHLTHQKRLFHGSSLFFCRVPENIKHLSWRTSNYCISLFWCFQSWILGNLGAELIQEISTYVKKTQHISAKSSGNTLSTK